MRNMDSLETVTLTPIISSALSLAGSAHVRYLLNDDWALVTLVVQEDQMVSSIDLSPSAARLLASTLTQVAEQMEARVDADTGAE